MQNSTFKRTCVCCGTELEIELSKTTGMNEQGHYFGKIPLSLKNNLYYFAWKKPGEHRWLLPKWWNTFWHQWFYWVDEPATVDSIWGETVRTCPIWELPWRKLIMWILNKVDPPPMAEYWECDRCYNKTGDE